MPWSSDMIATFRALWERFTRWERSALLREKEWLFPLEGTTEDFERRLRDLVPTVSRDEYFRMYDQWDQVGKYAFCESFQVAVKAPNPLRFRRVGRALNLQHSVHHFHGSFQRDSSGLYLCGRYRLTQRYAKAMLILINYIHIYFVGALIVAAGAYGVGLLTGAAMPQLFAFVLVIQFPAFAPLYALTIWLNGRFIEHRDRHARKEVYRLLQRICGNQAMRLSPQT